MTPRVRKLLLTAHISFSVGWVGAVAAFLVLSIAGLTSTDAEAVRGAYLAMDMIGRFLIVPMSLAALATGVIQGLATEWGLFQYYWVTVKFGLTVLATIALLLHQYTAVAEAAKRVSTTAAGTMPGADVGRLGTQLVGDASLAILLLLATTILSVYKPWGLTPFGRRKQGRPISNPGYGTNSAGASKRLKIALAIVVVVIVAFVALHLSGGGLGRHGH
jgi:hypothetical protein